MPINSIMLLPILAAIALATEAASPVTILIGVNGVMTAAFAKLYNDCRRDHRECRDDRVLLWKQIRELERKLG